MIPADPAAAEWRGRPVCVAGIARSGVAAAEALLRLGATVTVVDERAGDPEQLRAELLRALGARVALGPAAVVAPPEGSSLVVTSPGWRPTQPLLAAAAASSLPVWGEVELAWRLRGPDAAPWLALTGTNGKTTTVRMLTAMLLAGGHRTIAAGNVGTPLLEAVLATPAYDVLAVELSSFQLHWSASLQPAAAAILNVAPDHLDWHGSMADYAADKGRILHGSRLVVYNLEDPWSVRLSAGCPRRVGFGLGGPRDGDFGVRDGSLVGDGVELARVEDVRPGGRHNVANALAAAALARSYGVPAAAVAEGLRRFRPDGHRNASVAVVAGVTYVDDSKATNPHAAAASLAAYDSVVWVAGGLLKGADVGPLVEEAAGRLRGAVLIGRDRKEIGAALARHAPQVPVTELDVTDTGAMADVVRVASRLARPGDTVLLAPAAASMDMFRDYAARGDAFAAAVRALAGERAR